MQQSPSTKASVSVVIPVFNGATTIKAAVNSILKQTLLASEIIIIDDGSTDDTKKVVQAIESPIPIKYYYQDNQKQAAARNYGVTLARSRYIAFLDADDRWLPNKLADQVKCALSNPMLAAVVGNYQILDRGKITSFIPDVIDTKVFSSETLLTANFFWLPAVLIDRHIFNELGGFDITLANAEDVDFGFRLCKKYPFRVNPETVAIYQKRAFSSTHQEARDILNIVSFYKKVLERNDLTSEEKQLAENKMSFWRQRHRLFTIRWVATKKGQIAGLREYFKQLWPNYISFRSIGLFFLLLLPGSFRYLTKTRWQNLDFGDTYPELNI